MPCACTQCEQHAQTLGLTGKWLSRAALRKAFRAEAKRWHPDRFENDKARRSEAEEHFKIIQVAYRELWEHLESPVAAQPAPVPEAAEEPDPEPPRAKVPDPPHIFFGGAPGCYAWPSFPPAVADIIAGNLQESERAVAFVDLSRHGRGTKPPESYLLLTTYRMFLRNHLFIISLLWYTDLGEVQLVDLQKDGKRSLWQRIVEACTGIQQRYALMVFRHNGVPFCTLEGELDDSVKKVIYNFLRQSKPGSST